MTLPMKMANRCHPDKLNYYRGYCEECAKWLADPDAPCPHIERKKDIYGRCSSCMSRKYHLSRLNGEGDKFGTVRISSTMRSIKDPSLRKKLIKRKRRLKTYNLSLEDYDKMLNEQEGVCAICKLPPNKADLTVDHDHNCYPLGKSCGDCVRGLLCHGCNMRLGQLESDLVYRSLEYLEKFKYE